MKRGTGPFADPARPTRRELRRWQEGYRRAEQRQRALTVSAGFDQRRAVRMALDLLDFAPPADGGALRRRDVAAVRAIWRRMRAPFVARQ